MFLIVRFVNVRFEEEDYYALNLGIASRKLTYFFTKHEGNKFKVLNELIRLMLSFIYFKVNKTKEFRH